MSEAWSGDVRLAYDVRGEGDAVLFVHGLGYDRLGWGPLPGLLARDYRVITFDNRGVGESDLPDGPYSVAQMAADAIAVLDAAGSERAHVVGVSLGGFIAQEIALTYPERVQKLVLASTSPGGLRAWPMPQAGLDAFRRFPLLEREAGLRLMVENSLGARGVTERPELFEEIFAYRLERAGPLAGWQAQAVAGALFDAYERLPQIAAPTLVLHGGADNVIDPRNGELLAVLIPGATLEAIPDRGHLLVWEEGELLSSVVKRFLAS